MPHGTKKCELCPILVHVGKRCYDCRQIYGHENTVPLSFLKEQDFIYLEPWTAKDVYFWQMRNRTEVNFQKNKLIKQLQFDGFVLTFQI